MSRSVFCRRVIDIVWLDLVCCTRLIRIIITVCSANFHLLLLEFDVPELRPQLTLWRLKYQGVERPNLLGLSCRLRFECGMTFPTLCSTPERWMGSFRCPGSLISLYGPTFHVTPVDLCIIFQCNLYISCIVSCGNKIVSKIVSRVQSTVGCLPEFCLL